MLILENSLLQTCLDWSLQPPRMLHTAPKGGSKLHTAPKAWEKIWDQQTQQLSKTQSRGKMVKKAENTSKFK